MTEDICKNCDHAEFCEDTGKYKCVLYGHYVYFPDLVRICFVKKKERDDHGRS